MTKVRGRTGWSFGTSTSTTSSIRDHSFLYIGGCQTIDATHGAVISLDEMSMTFPSPTNFHVHNGFVDLLLLWLLFWVAVPVVTSLGFGISKYGYRIVIYFDTGSLSGSTDPIENIVFQRRCYCRQPKWWWYPPWCFVCNYISSIQLWFLNSLWN